MLQKHLDCWKKVVTFPWDEDWQPEYDHDIGCRYWLQLAIEHATPVTRERLLTIVHPLDEMFKKRMRPSPRVMRASKGPFMEHPYFWETHTLMSP
jgi:hypothetical protein